MHSPAFVVRCRKVQISSAHICTINYPHEHGAVTYSAKSVQGSHLHKESCSKAQALLLPARQRLALFYSSPEPRLQQDKGTCQELLAAEASDRPAA